MKITRDREKKEVITYNLAFEWNDIPGAGFSFSCDENGCVDIEKMYPEARENLNKCLCGEYNVRFAGVRKNVNRFTETAIGICNICGEKVYLEGFTNTCEKCGTDYNMSGQQLAPRQFWGEETGETLGDILMIK